MTTKRWRFLHSRIAADFIPVVFGILVAVFYFMAAVPGSRQFLSKYLWTALAVFVLTRIPNIWVHQKILLPPIRRYKRGKRNGRAFSRTELADFYRAFAAHLPQTQMLAVGSWAGAILVFAAVQWFWIQASWEAVLAVLFTGVISATLSMAFTYFLVKRLITPLIEEVGTLLDVPPDVSDRRVTFFFKAGISVLCLTTLAFLAYGVLLHARLSGALDDFALKAGSEDSRTMAYQLGQTPDMHWKALLLGKANPLFSMVILDQEGRAVADLASGPFDKSLFLKGLALPQKSEQGRRVALLRHDIMLYSILENRTLALTANPESLDRLMNRMIGAGLLFLILTVAVQSTYILWLSRDMSMTLRRVVDCNKRLASGDLSRVPNIWSDDELGILADDLRAAFRGLIRMTQGISSASVATDEEVARTVAITEVLHAEVSVQTASADQTTQSVKAMEEGMRKVSAAMEQVALATQEVSSTILELQASIEEIARNSDVLMRSVEKTASSSNEISASATSVQSSTDKLFHSGQEAVSFFAELDASLEETRRNSRSLSETSTRVTQDAEAGFSAVAAVEDEILRTSRATEQSQAALAELLGSIGKIGRTVELIQDVTEQTNLLSLNASIIAAGAGEHGKSFAVVATQIRELSARTAGSAKDIRSVIRSLSKSGEEMAAALGRTSEVVSRSTDLSRNAGETLRTILESAAGQEEMSKKIATATEELAHGGQAANRAMHGIFEMMETIATAAKDQVSSTQYLNRETERVRDVALQLRNATEEQAKGTAVIGQAMTQIMDDNHQASQAIQLQTRESGAIYEAMRQVAATAQSIESAFLDLARASENLKASASSLRNEIKTFKM